MEHTNDMEPQQGQTNVLNSRDQLQFGLPSIVAQKACIRIINTSIVTEGKVRRKKVRWIIHKYSIFKMLERL